MNAKGLNTMKNEATNNNEATTPEAIAITMTDKQYSELVNTQANGHFQAVQALLNPERIDNANKAKKALDYAFSTDEVSKLAVCKILHKVKENGLWQGDEYLDKKGSKRKFASFNQWALHTLERFGGGTSQATLDNYVLVGKYVTPDGKGDVLPKQGKSKLQHLEIAFDYSGTMYTYAKLLAIVYGCKADKDSKDKEAELAANIHEVCTTGKINPTMSKSEIQKALKEWKDERTGKAVVVDEAEATEAEATEAEATEAEATEAEATEATKPEAVKVTFELTKAEAEALARLLESCQGAEAKKALKAVKAALK